MNEVTIARFPGNEYRVQYGTYTNFLEGAEVITITSISNEELRRIQEATLQELNLILSNYINI